MRLLRLGAAFLIFAAAASEAHGELRLPRVIGDRMVLTQRARACLWGFASPGERVRVTPSWSVAAAEATTSALGRFDVEIDTPSAGGPYTITFEGANKVVVNDVLVGEVWLCSGQSNMEMPIAEAGTLFHGIANWRQELAAAREPLIRFFEVTNRAALTPEVDCEGTWRTCTPETAGALSAAAYFFGRELAHELSVPIGLITADWSGTPAQAWMSAEALRAHGGFDEGITALASKPANPRGVDPRRPTVLFNGMIAPLVPYSMRGVIWYQGEGNRDRAVEYRTLFPALIREWRTKLAQPDLSFYYAQIAPYAYADEEGQTPLLRDAQLAALSTPRTGMVVTMDIGDALDIHPANKQDVGRRFAAWALAHDYQRRDVPYSGPLCSGVSRESAKLRVHFDHAGGGLVMRGAALGEFEIAGADGRFVPATATLDGETLLVASDSVSEPRMVRYAWRAACESTLSNRHGLPASPFTVQVSDASVEPGSKPLFNGRDLTGWSNVNCASSTWTARDGVLHCSGLPTGVLCTERRYENFVLDVEWRHLEAKGNAGIFVWSDPSTARGQPFTRAVEVQVLDGQEGDWFTSDGDVFPIHGATLVPENGRGGSRAFPTEKRMHAAPEWNHYRITCDGGAISLAVNGKVVTRGRDASPREGYICLESEGSPVEFKNLWIRELPPSKTPLAATHSAAVAVSRANLYNGIDLSGWRAGSEQASTWRADDWTLKTDGGGAVLWTEKSYRDFVLTLDWRRAPGGANATDVVGAAQGGAILVRGDGAARIPLTVSTSDAPTDAEPWKRIEITLRGRELGVVENGVARAAPLTFAEGRESGPLGLAADGRLEFANLFVREAMP